MGIGQALVNTFAQDSGLQVFTCARNLKTDAPEHKVSCWTLDLSVPEDCRTLADRVMQQAGRIDVLINNAAIYQRGEIAKASVEDIQAVIKTNFMAACILCSIVLPIMRAQNFGRIVNVSSSITRMKDLSNRGIYAASKAALDMLTRAAAHENRRFNIKVNAICPGRVKTRMDVDGLAGNSALDIVPHIVKLAELAEDGPSGEFYSLDRSIAWEAKYG